MMKILLTNDDGIEAEGLTQAAALVAPVASEIAIFAPKCNQSGVGHAVTLWREIEIVRVAARGEVKECWRIDGTPTDAIKFGLDNRDWSPDLVISGINNGLNIGDGVHYSGTVSAAIEAYFHRIPALALSVENFRQPRWETAIFWGRKIIERILPLFDKPRTQRELFLLNINFPDLPSSRIKGLRMTRQSAASFQEKFLPAVSGRENFYSLDGEMVCEDDAEDLDLNAVHAGWVSISPLQSSLNDNAMRRQFAALFQ